MLGPLKGPSHDEGYTAHLLVLQGDFHAESTCALGAILFSAGVPEGEQASESGALAEQA